MNTFEPLKSLAEIQAAERAARLAEGITYPRRRHSHRCRQCGSAVYCYRAECTRPQRVDRCQWCR